MAAPLNATHYGRLASAYRWLEYAAFGRGLQRARECYLDRLASCHSVLVLGAGDGRCFSPLLRAAPRARVVSVELEPAFIAAARREVENLGETARVQFTNADARAWEPPECAFDAVVTQFFLDCFPPPELDGVIRNVLRGLKPSGRWIFADFDIPERPAFARWRAQLVIRILCAFFRWQANHPLKSLPPMHEALVNAGLARAQSQTRHFGLIRSSVYHRTANLGEYSTTD